MALQIWWLIGVGLLAVGALFGYRAVQGEQRRAERAERELRAIRHFTDQVSPSDWQGSVQTLLSGIISHQIGRAVALVAATESGALELRAYTCAPGEPEWDPATTEDHARLALEAKAPAIGTGAIYLPLIDNSEGLGVLALRGSDPNAPAVHAAARLCTLALSGIRSFRRQAALSNTDGLTGLANHRHFQQMLATALGQAYLEGEALAVILVDIDRFKAVNDTYGHLFGDLVLREISYALRRTLPDSAFAARYGGEELVVLLRGDDAERAPQIAESIRQSVERHEVMDFTTGVKLAVTVSAGVALYELGQGKSRLIARADEALYASKHNGRNRVTIAPPEEITSSMSPS